MKKYLALMLFLVLCLSLMACSKPQMSGIILEVGENDLLLARDLTTDEYKKMKDESPTSLQNEHVNGERDDLDLVVLTYDQVADFSKGDSVDVWIDGGIMTSYPAQAHASKIVRQK